MPEALASEPVPVVVRLDGSSFDQALDRMHSVVLERMEQLLALSSAHPQLRGQPRHRNGGAGAGAPTNLLVAS